VGEAVAFTAAAVGEPNRLLTVLAPAAAAEAARLSWANER
jgi:hypothetical protein